MSEGVEQILQAMQELTDVVRNHDNDRASIDEEKLKDALAQQVSDLVAARVQDTLPAYHLPGRAVWADGESGVQKGNRYYDLIQGIHRDGYYRDGNNLVRAADLVLAEYVMNSMHVVSQQKGSVGIGGPVRPASDDLQAAVKTLTSTGSGTGDELVPTDMAMMFWDDIWLASRVASSLITVAMPTNPFDIPQAFGEITWRKGAERTATTSSDPATAKSTLTATELVTQQGWSYTLNEDAVVALMPGLRSRLAQSGAAIIDAFMLNADATETASSNINLIDGTPPNDAYYLTSGQDGMRHQALVDNTAMANSAGGDALTDADVTTALAEMGKYAANPNECLIITDVSTYLNGFLKLETVTTLDKFGPKATVLTGQLAAYRGIPIVVSASLPLTNDAGKVPAAGGTLGSFVITNRQMWYAGYRRDMMIEVDRDIQKREYIMVTSMRPAIAAHGTRASATHTAVVYNILV